MNNLPILAKVYRGDRVESEHYGHAVIADRNGKIVYQFGDPTTRVYLRSAAKPVQAVPLVEDNLAEKFGFTNKEMALACASHNGENFHVGAAQSMLQKIGLTKNHLQCGVHRPLGVDLGCVTETSRYDVLQNNCSGKHSGMLAACVLNNWPVENYLDPNHPHQQRIKARISENSDLPEKEIGVGIDGCSAPVFNLPLQNLATLYARLADKTTSGNQCFQFMSQNPEMVAGTKRFDTTFMNAMNGKAIAKIGAEGLECVAIDTSEPLGLAVKISDGNNRAAPPVVLALLKRLELISDTELQNMQEYVTPEIRNHYGILVGRVFCEHDF